jgi:hypothetical protein
MKVHGPWTVSYPCDRIGDIWTDLWNTINICWDRHDVGPWDRANDMWIDRWIQVRDSWDRHNPGPWARGRDHGIGQARWVRSHGCLYHTHGRGIMKDHGPKMVDYGTDK